MAAVCGDGMVDPRNYSLKEKVGSGAYGLVYKATDRKGNQVAIKRNVTDRKTHGISSLKEINMLVRVSGHPHVVDYKGAFTIDRDDTSLFKDKLGKRFRSTDVNDTLHFVLGLETTNMEQMIKHQVAPRDIKYMCGQLLLSLEWIHSRGVVHRDIKPSNVLVKYTGSVPHIKVCDFGLCGVNTKAPLMTPGVVTSWYRAPEICMEQPYTSSIDVWSAGAVFYELLAKTPLLCGTKDSPEDILLAIFKMVPEIASRESIDRMVGGENSVTIAAAVRPKLSQEACKFISLNISQEERFMMVAERLRGLISLNVKEVQMFNENGDCGTFSQFCDLLSRMLCFDPRYRLSASEALMHPFFQWYRSDVKITRSIVTRILNQQDDTIQVTIKDVRERRIAHALIIELWNNRFAIPWYDHRLIFHAMDAYDRHPCPRDAPHHDVYLTMYSHLYMFHKFFSTLEPFYSWKSFAPSGYSDQAAKDRAALIEMKYVTQVCKCQIYRPTIFEMLSEKEGRVRESRVRDCIVALGNIQEWNGTLESLYDSFGETTNLT